MNCHPFDVPKPWIRYMWNLFTWVRQEDNLWFPGEVDLAGFITWVELVWFIARASFPIGLIFTLSFTTWDPAELWHHCLAFPWKWSQVLPVTLFDSDLQWGVITAIRLSFSNVVTWLQHFCFVTFCLLYPGTKRKIKFDHPHQLTSENWIIAYVGPI